MVILKKLNFFWRWFATAFSFIVFGIGGILMPVVVVPILYLLPGNHQKRAHRGQKVIHYAFRSFIWMMKVMGVLTYEVTGIEKLKDAKLVLANHPSLLDIVFLIACVPNANCVVKSKLLRNPFIRGPVKAAGYIINNDEADAVITTASQVFADGRVVIVFPEGTRTTPSQKIKLKRGAANIAVRTGAEITPVIIGCSPTTLTKDNPWYHVPDKRMHFTIQVKDNLDVAAAIADLAPSKAARNLTNTLSEYFNREIGVYE